MTSSAIELSPAGCVAAPSIGEKGAAVSVRRAPARVDLAALKAKADPACRHCPNRRPALNPARAARPRAAVACPVMDWAGRWGWPCHRTMAEVEGAR